MTTPIESNDKLAYSVQNLAAAADVSVMTINRAMRANKLSPRYIGRKPIIPVEEARRWLNSLPEEAA